MSVNIRGMMKSIRNIMREDTGLNGDAQRIEQLRWMIFIKILSDKEKELELMEDDYVTPLPPEYHWDEWAGDDEGITGDELLNFVDRKLFPGLRELDVSAGKSGEFYTPRAVTRLITDMIDPRLGEVILDPACGTGGFITCTIEHLKKQIKRGEERRLLQENVRGWEHKPLPFLLATTNLILHDIEVPNLTYGDSLSRPLNEYRQKDRVDAILANPPFGGVVAHGNEKNFPQNFRTKESADLFLLLMIRLLKNGGRAGIVLPDGSLTGEGVKQRVREKWLTECNLHTIIRLPNSVFAPYATVATNLLFFEKGKPTKEIWYYEHKLPEGQKSYSKTKPVRVEEFDPVKKWWNNREESELAWKAPIDTIREHGWDLDIKNPNFESIYQL